MTELVLLCIGFLALVPTFGLGDRCSEYDTFLAKCTANQKCVYTEGKHTAPEALIQAILVGNGKDPRTRSSNWQNQSPETSCVDDNTRNDLARHSNSMSLFICQPENAKFMLWACKQCKDMAIHYSGYDPSIPCPPSLARRSPLPLPTPFSPSPPSSPRLLSPGRRPLLKRTFIGGIQRFSFDRKTFMEDCYGLDFEPLESTEYDEPANAIEMTGMKLKTPNGRVTIATGIFYWIQRVANRREKPLSEDETNELLQYTERQMETIKSYLQENQQYATWGYTICYQIGNMIQTLV